jgi:ribose-phosphate pyrophosphokinase
VLFNTVLFTGNANPVLAQEIATHLGSELGKAKVGRFSDGEVDIEIQQNVRARDVFVVQSTGAPTNENLMELLIMVDALKRASARRITAVIPYFGYARQDRRPRSTRVPISAKVVANLLQTVGVERLLTMDLHADQIQGFFDIPVDNIYASPVLSPTSSPRPTATSSWSRRTSAASCAPAPSPSSSVATWRSSTSAARRPTSPKSCT